MNFLKPPPVPETPTVTRISGCSFRNSSATASVIGNTVLEPSTWTFLTDAPALPPQLTRPRVESVIVAAIAIGAGISRVVMLVPPLCTGGEPSVAPGGPKQQSK